MKRISWALQAALFYLFTLLVSCIPARFAPRVGRLTGQFMFRLLPGRRRIALDNIRQALPYMKTQPLWNSSSESPEELALETFANLGHSLTEVCRLYHGKGENVIKSIELRGREQYEAARAKGKGLIFLTGHCGNWELVALAFSSLFDEGMSVVARRQNNPYINRMVERMRMRYNSNVIYKQGALKGILSTLKKGKLIGLLADQAVSPAEGVLIHVMGRTAWASKAPVIIAQKSGASLLPTFIHREGDRQIITFHPEHRLSDDMSEQGIQLETQALARYVEDFIVAYPTQWYWVHRRWKRAGEVVA
jgi:Kdo2-lipid IVA lauroyltransferase/acyltransferase